MVRVVAVQLHFTVPMALTFAELLNVALLIEHATPSTALPTGAVVPPESEEAHAESPASMKANGNESQ